MLLAIARGKVSEGVDFGTSPPPSSPFPPIYTHTYTLHTQAGSTVKVDVLIHLSNL